jgi:thioredoxin 1
MEPASPPAPPLLMACLCAAWCDTCRDYRSVFDTCAAAFGDRVLPVWIDIEDQAELLGAYDVENFPTVLLASGDDTLAFAGAITPQPETLARMVASALAGSLVAGARDSDAPALTELPQRLRRWVADAGATTRRA